MPELTTGSFERHQVTSGGKNYSYWLFKPSLDVDSQPLPLVVMLHGCKQDGVDFAWGTAMNELAKQKRCLVMYPEQRKEANSMGCWNWFEPGHQHRGAGEPAMIADLALEVAAAHGGDTLRIYVAGLSAGGAMATLVGQLYPEVFAAVGVHSGLPAESAHDVMSAMNTMRKPETTAIPPAAGIAMPTIVFHGASDRTVHPANGARIVQESVAAIDGSGVPLKCISGNSLPSERPVRHTVHSAEDGQVWVENWEIAGAPHAWSGGSVSGSFTDPRGPDASAAMLEFFLKHRRAT